MISNIPHLRLKNQSMAKRKGRASSFNSILTLPEQPDYFRPFGSTNVMIRPTGHVSVGQFIFSKETSEMVRNEPQEQGLSQNASCHIPT